MKNAALDAAVEVGYRLAREQQEGAKLIAIGGGFGAVDGIGWIRKRAIE